MKYSDSEVDFLHPTRRLLVKHWQTVNRPGSRLFGCAKDLSDHIERRLDERAVAASLSHEENASENDRQAAEQPSKQQLPATVGKRGGRRPDRLSLR